MSHNVWLGLYLYTLCLEHVELIVNQSGVPYYNGLSTWYFYGGWGLYIASWQRNDVKLNHSLTPYLKHTSIEIR